MQKLQKSLITQRNALWFLRMKTKAPEEKVTFNARLPKSLVEEIKLKSERSKMSQTDMAIVAFKKLLSDPKFQQIAKMHEEIASFKFGLDQSQDLELAA